MWHTKYTHIPFIDKGRDEKGADCWGLVRMVYKNELGIDLPSYAECYRDTKDGELITPHILAVKDEHWHDVQEPKEFDLIILRHRGFPWHVGMVISSRKMIHCGHGFGTVVEAFPSIRWPENKIVGFARYGAGA